MASTISCSDDGDVQDRRHCSRKIDERGSPSPSSPLNAASDRSNSSSPAPPPPRNDSTSPSRHTTSAPSSPLLTRSSPLLTRNNNTSNKRKDRKNPAALEDPPTSRSCTASPSAPTTPDPPPAGGSSAAGHSKEGEDDITMKQERDGSPEPDVSPALAKSLPANSMSLAHEALFSLAAASEAASAESTAELTKLHISTMLQGLPFLFSDLHRMPPNLGSVPAVAAAAAAAAESLRNQSSSSSSGSGASGGVQCVCGVKFTSRTNMEAHKKFYCTLQANVSGLDSSDSGRQDTSEGTEEGGGGWGLLKCPHCSYTTTHKLSLNGHMNIHTTAPDDRVVAGVSPSSASSAKQKPSSAGAAGCSTDNARAPDRYCSDCDIQFSSLKTFRVHKSHYCQTRHVQKQNKSPVRDDPPSSVPGVVGNPNHSQPVLLLPTDPMLLVPYSVIVGASVLPAHVLPQQHPAVLTADGQLLSLANTIANSHKAAAAAAPSPMLSPNLNVPVSYSNPSSNSSNSSPQISPKILPKSESTTSKSSKDETKVSLSVPTGSKRRGDSEYPLDLTVKRSKLVIKSDLLGDEEKENREVNTRSLSNSPAGVRNGSSSGSVTGEFEGKLLHSPAARASPSSEGGERASPRSPRPASAAPNLSSPRSGPHESPKASTSSAIKSPGQNSPTLPQSILPQLTPGFPNLIPGLDGGLNTLPFTSLQYLQGIQSVTPDILLKMFNGIVPPLSTPNAAPMKQGEAKCNECNITFFKEENYLVHKKHYCAARDKTINDNVVNRTSTPPGGSRASISPPARAAVKTEIPSSSSAHSSKSKSGGQYQCIPCGIKFTSPDNLSAHQAYYCAKSEGSSSEERVTKGMWKCPRCRVVMLDTLQAAHQCVSPGTTSAHGWKCPCCPMLSPTAAAAQKHLETHAGIKAFRCTICGYRGNTLRGMRTHIRMHFEKRTNDLHEENFIECILEDDDRRFRVNNSQVNNHQSLIENPSLAAVLSNCAKPPLEMSDVPINCTMCPYISTNKSTFIKHLAIAHNLGNELKRFLESHREAPPQSTNQKNDKEPNGSPSASITPPLLDVKLEPEVKLEIADNDEDINMDSHCKSPVDDTKDMSSSSQHSKANGSSTSSRGCHDASGTGHRCLDCNIYFSLPDNYEAHRRYYCPRHQSNTPPETTVQ